MSEETRPGSHVPQGTLPAGEPHPGIAGPGKASATSGEAEAPRTYTGSGRGVTDNATPSAHRTLLLGVSELTWAERFDSEYRRLNGPVLGAAVVQGTAARFATRTMLDEIHLMLRVLVDAALRHGGAT